MKRIENHIAKSIQWVWTDCIVCGGKGTIPKNSDNLDDDREIDCAECDGKGGYYVKR